jgi:NAD+ kinase
VIPPVHAALKTVALIGKHLAPGISKTLEALIDLVQCHGHRVILERNTAQVVRLASESCLSLEEIGLEADVVIVLGGDGTMLDAARRLASFKVPLIGINFGRLGFMTDIPSAQVSAVLPPMLAGYYEQERRSLLSARVIRGRDEFFSACALNDVVVNRSGMSGMLELAVSVEDQLMYHQRADGLILATPTGSTAYALAAGGPILHPSLAGIVLTPIAPHSLSNRPIVLAQDTVISIEIISTRAAVVNFDMQSLTQLESGDRVIIQRADDTATFLHPLGYNYFASLREKLRWHDMPSDAATED